MKILIGIIVVLGLGWLLLGTGADTDTGTENTTMEENMEEGSMEEGENSAMMEGEEVAFDITGENFAFSETEIRVKEGDTVTVNFESTDGFHDFVVDEFEAATDQVNPGTPTSVTFVADQAGEFEFYCSVGNHREQGMVGTLIVEEADSAMEEAGDAMMEEAGEAMDETGEAMEETGESMMEEAE